MVYSKFVKTKAARLVEEKQVIPICQGFDSSHWEVQGDSATYAVVLSSINGASCTCPYWTHKHQPCSHILAALLQTILMVEEE